MVYVFSPFGGYRFVDLHDAAAAELRGDLAAVHRPAPCDLQDDRRRAALAVHDQRGPCVGGALDRDAPAANAEQDAIVEFFAQVARSSVR